MSFRNLNKASGGRRILGTPYIGLLAAQIVAETTTGDNGPGILYNEAGQPEHSGKRLRAHITSWPASGSLRVEENGSVLAAGFSDGIYSVPYDFLVDDVVQGAGSFTLAIGVVDATAAGATLTGAASMSAGSASGTASASAPGATLTGTASIVPGTAVGVSAGDAPGAILTGSASMLPGSASGNSTVSATAPGAVLTGSAAISPGRASGNVRSRISPPWARDAGRIMAVPRRVCVINCRSENMAFANKKTGEELWLGFDLARNLRRGESVLEVSFSISVLSGTDASSGAMLSGAPTISGSIVEQFFVSGVAGCSYEIAAEVTTSRGNIFIERRVLSVVI